MLASWQRDGVPKVDIGKSKLLTPEHPRSSAASCCALYSLSVGPDHRSYRWLARQGVHLQPLLGDCRYEIGSTDRLRDTSRGHAEPHFGPAIGRRSPHPHRLSRVFRRCAIHSRRQPSGMSRVRIGRAGTHPRQGPRPNIARHDRPGRGDSVIANGHTERDRRRTTDPDIGATTNRRNPDWTRWLHAMVVRVENGYQVSDRAIVTDYHAMIGHDRGETRQTGLGAEL